MIFEESEKVELKEIYTPDVKKEVIAFVNTHGGVVYIGVTDSGQVVGIESMDATMQQLTNALRYSIRPDVTMFTSTEIVQVDGKSIIKLTVSDGTRKPYYLQDKGMRPSGVYVRQGTSSAQASEDAIHNMIKLSDGNSFEMARSLNQNLTFHALSEEMERRNLEFGPIQQKNLGILNEDDMYTNVGLLVSDQCKHSIKVAIFQGDDKSVFKDRHELTGSLFTQIKDVNKVIEFYNATKATFDETFLRTDERAYPLNAIRESILNAIIHRDYSCSGSISINIFVDRMEIISLGGLVPTISMDAVMMGASQPRNEKLAALFYRMKLIESYGIGISRIIGDYKGTNLKPDFTSVQGAFRVVLPNCHYNTTPLSETQEKVMEYLKNHEKITRIELESLLHVKLTRANAILKELLDANLIQKDGSGKNTVYIAK